MAHDPEGNSFFSGFEAVIALPPTAKAEERAVHLRLVTRDGAVFQRPLGTLTLLPGDGRAPRAVAWPGEGPRVASAWRPTSRRSTCSPPRWTR